MMPTVQHETVALALPWSDEDEMVDIDAGIVPLIRALWIRRLPTVASCENQAGYVHIAFAAWSGVTAFVEMAALGRRVEIVAELPDKPPPDGRWIVRRSDCSVRFPRKHLGRVTQAVWNARERSPAEQQPNARRAPATA